MRCPFRASFEITSSEKHLTHQFAGLLIRVILMSDFPLIMSGRGSVWLERCVRDAEVGGSNPLAPTKFKHKSHGMALTDSMGFFVIINVISKLARKAQCEHIEAHSDDSFEITSIYWVSNLQFWKERSLYSFADSWFLQCFEASVMP